MKSVILMTTAIFLVSAPAPDAKTINEISAGFLSPSTETALSAADAVLETQLSAYAENKDTRLFN